MARRPLWPAALLLGASLPLAVQASEAGGDDNGGWQSKFGGALRLNLDHASGAYEDSELSGWEPSLYDAELSWRLRHGRWSSKLELGMGRGDNAPSLGDAWLGLEMHESLQLRAGRLKPDYGMENSTSSKNVWFVERSMAASALSSERGEGLGLLGELGGWNASVNLSRHDNDEDGEPIDGVYSRLVYSGDPGERRHWQLGASLGRQAYDGAEYRIRSDAELDVAGSQLKSPNDVAALEALLYAAEAAWVEGPLALQAEYLAQRVTTLDDADFSIDGYALALSWFLDDSQHRYRGGVLRSVKPSGKDAVELAARYGCLDLRAGDEGDAGCTTTLGVNYYWRRSTRLSANLTRLTRAEDKSDGEALSLRAQWRF